MRFMYEKWRLTFGAEMSGLPLILGEPYISSFGDLTEYMLFMFLLESLDSRGIDDVILFCMSKLLRAALWAYILRAWYRS